MSGIDAGGGIGTAPAAKPKVDYSTLFKPKVIGGGGDAAPPPPVLLIQGTKNSKTIAAVMADVSEDEKHLATGRFHPEGTRTMVLSFDNQSQGSLAKHYGDNEAFCKAGVEVLHIKREMNYLEGNPRDGTRLCEATRDFLRGMAEDREKQNIGLLVLDRFDLYMEALKLMCHDKAGKAIDVKLEQKTDYGIRKPIIASVIGNATNAVVDGGLVVVTMPELVRDGDVALRPTGEFETKRNGDKREIWAMITQASYDAVKIEHWVSAFIKTYCLEQEGSKKKTFVADCLYSRIEPWASTEGKTCNITGTHLMAFRDHPERVTETASASLAPSDGEAAPKPGEAAAVVPKPSGGIA